MIVSDHSEHIYLFLTGGAASWLASAAISTMPQYTGANYWGKWLYGFLQLVGANLNKVLPPKP